jgi:tetratricopeptide (TPR) repeat protein
VGSFVIEVARVLAHGEEDPPIGRAAPADAASSAGLLERAIRLAEARRFTEALSLASRILSREEQAVDARIFRGRVLLELNRPAAARAEAEQALLVRPGDPMALLLRGRAAEAMDDENAALADYGLVIERLPNSVEARARRGLLRIRRARIEEGLEDVAVAISRDPLHAVALKAEGMAFFYRRETGQAFTSFDKVVKRDPDDWEGWFYRGLVRIYRDPTIASSPPSLARLRQSVVDFTGAITADPRQRLPYVYRGDVHLGLGDYERARADYDRALALGPETANLRFQRGLAQLSLDRFDLAIEDFRRVVVLDPAITAAPYNIACAHARAGRPDEAMEWLGKAVAAGFLDGAGNLEHMKADPDLVSLRKRPDFRRLLRANRAD